MGDRSSRGRKILTLVALLAIILLGELFARLWQATSQRIVDRNQAYVRLRCEDHGRVWIPSDPNDPSKGTCL